MTYTKGKQKLNVESTAAYKKQGKTTFSRPKKNNNDRNQQYVYECRPQENGNGAQSFAELLDAVSHTFSPHGPTDPFRP